MKGVPCWERRKFLKNDSHGDLNNGRMKPHSVWFICLFSNNNTVYNHHGQGIITFYFSVFFSGTSFLLFGKVFQGNKNQMGHKNVIW